MVETFICPKDFGVPDRRKCNGLSHPKGVQYHKTGSQEDGKAVDFGPTDSRPSSKLPSHSGKDISNRETTKKARLDEVKCLMSEVKELTATSFVGLAKKKHKDDALTRLGVDAPKQQTMPIKMALGIREGRLKRHLKNIDKTKESGVVLSKNFTREKVKEVHMGKNTGKRSREQLGGLDIGTRKGVFHLKRSRLPASLVRKK